MPRPKRQPNSPDTHEQILDAARQEFALNGVSTPLDAIAARCGIRRPSLLHHFPSKQALITAVIDRILDQTRSRLLDAIAQGDGDYGQTMAKIITGLRELEAEEQGVGGMLLHALLAEHEPGPVTERLQELINVIYSTALIVGADQGRPQDEIRAAIAQLVMGEFARMALTDRAERIWGEADGVNPLFKSYFLTSVFIEQQ